MDFYKCLIDGSDSVYCTADIFDTTPEHEMGSEYITIN